MQPQTKQAKILQIQIPSYSIKSGFAIYTLQITGCTAFMLQKSAIFYKTTRYSHLRQLHNYLKADYKQYCIQHAITFPPFPPKKYFNHLSASFLDQRLALLNKYIAAVFAILPDIQSSPRITSLCLPLKADILICGSNETLNNSYIDRLAQLIFSSSSEPLGLEYFSQKTSTLAPNKSETIASALESNCEHTYTSPFSKYICNKHKYSDIFPCDYLFHERVFRINIEEQSMNSYLNAAILSNRAIKWVENNAAMIVAIDLTDKGSVDLASLIIEKMKELASHSQLPMMVIIGMGGDAQALVNDKEINSFLISKKSEYLPLKYLHVDLATGENVVECLHYILWVREIRYK